MSLEKPRCPYCSSDRSSVIDSRGSWRRRECLDCNERFSTDETVRPAYLMRELKHRIPHVRRQPNLLA